MDSLKYTWILCQIVICECQVKYGFLQKNEETCQKHARDPYFDSDLVIRQPWTVYYTWNIRMNEKCYEMDFRNATKKAIRSIKGDMADLMDVEPYWETATFHLRTTLGPTKHELLLFADQGPAGRFSAVPNMHDSEYVLSAPRKIPLMKFFIKLVRNGKYLLMMDCHVGGVTLSARSSDRPYLTDVASTAASLQLGEGHHACTREKHKGEQMYLKDE